MNKFDWTMVAIAMALSLWVGSLLNETYHVEAQTKDVPPYKIAQLPDDIMVYKQVYQGCELFTVISVTSRGADGVAITTGRGCK